MNKTSDLKPESVTTFAEVSETAISDTDMSCSQKKVGWKLYLSITVMCYINLLNYMDRYTIAGVLTNIQIYYDINDAQGGLLQTVFMVFFIVCSPICGYLGDRYNRKYIMFTGIAMWVVAVLVSSYIPKDLFWLFLVIRGVTGVGESSYATLSPSMIADMFTGNVRSRMLMVFYFFVPVGCGMGYIVGGLVSSATGQWQWSVRTTAILGLIGLVLIAVCIFEPERGKAEKEFGQVNSHIVPTSYWKDIWYLLTNATYITSTIGYTATVFVVGTLAFWDPSVIEYRDAYKSGFNSTDQLGSRKDQITTIFGIITCVGGIIGVAAGTILSYWIRMGSGPFRFIKTDRSDAIICALGAAIAVPCCLFFIICMKNFLIISWILLAVCIVTLSFNWATNVDLLMSVVIPSRRVSANSWQILISHLFGDASGPYILGVISDWIRHGKTSQYDHFHSLITSFYIPNVVLVISATFYIIAALTFPRDQEKFRAAMGTERINSDHISDQSSLPDKTGGTEKAISKISVEENFVMRI